MCVFKVKLYQKYLDEVKVKKDKILDSYLLEVL